MDPLVPPDLLELFLTDDVFAPTTAAGTEQAQVDPEETRFTERLEGLMSRQLAQMTAFAEKEGRPEHQIRRWIALQHARYLVLADRDSSALSLRSDQPASNTTKTTHTNTNESRGLVAFLRAVSRALESLHSIFHIDALLLVVSPHDPPASVASTSKAQSTDAWLGGTPLGRDFWRGLRGGGVAGAKAFKDMSADHYRSALQKENSGWQQSTSGTSASTKQTILAASPLPTTSGGIKTELNRLMRERLRAASSNVLAEMKWTKPSSLSSLYGVALMGWPTDIPFKNPSENSKEINKRLLESLRDGAIQFVRETSERQSPEEMEREAKRPKISNLIT